MVNTLAAGSADNVPLSKSTPEPSIQPNSDEINANLSTRRTKVSPPQLRHAITVGLDLLTSRQFSNRGKRTPLITRPFFPVQVTRCHFKRLKLLYLLFSGASRHATLAFSRCRVSWAERSVALYACFPGQCPLVGIASCRRPINPASMPIWQACASSQAERSVAVVSVE